VAAFVAECERTAPEKGAPAAEVYEAYQRWCQGEGCDPVTQTVFSLTVRDRLQVETKRTAQARMLGLKTPASLAAVL
jgi:phage/plasmid-associated DNA primase